MKRNKLFAGVATLLTLVSIVFASFQQVQAQSTSLWYLSGSDIRPNVSSWGLKLTNVTGSTQCLHADTNGVVSGTGSDCGSGSGGSSFAYPFPSNATSTLLDFSGGLQVGSLSGFVGANNGTLYSFATSTVFGGATTPGYVWSYQNGAWGAYATSSSASMVYPGAGIAVSTGSAWGTSLTDNSTNWNTAYTDRITGANYPLSISSNVLSVVATSSATTPLTFTASTNAYGIQVANTSQSGYLTSTDWNTFNGKQSNLSLLTGTYTNGDMCTYNSSGTLLNCNTAVPTGTVTSVAETVPTGLTISGSPITTSGTLAVALQSGYNIPLTASTTNWNTAYNEAVSSWTSPLQYSGGTASILQSGTSQNGYLSSTDWNTFNGKQAALTGTTGQFPYFSGTNTVTATSSLFLATSGNVGIGTTTPYSKLSVAGNVVVGASSAGGTMGTFTAGNNTFYINASGEIQGEDKNSGNTGQITPMRFPSFKIATTTAWTGSSTEPYSIDIPAPFTGQITQIQCSTDVGTLTLEGTDGATHVYLPNASTTIGTNSFSLSFTQGDLLNFVAGNPATSPTWIACTPWGYQTP